MNNLPLIREFAPAGLAQVVGHTWASTGAYIYPLMRSGAGGVWTVSGFKYIRNTANADSHFNLRLQYTTDGINWTECAFSGLTVPAVGVWYTAPDFVSDPIPSNAIATRAAIDLAGTVPSDYEMDGSGLSITTSVPQLPLMLEVETEATGVINRVQNPDGEWGGFGWITPLTGTYIRTATPAETGSVQGLAYGGTNSTAHYFNSEPVACNPAQYVRGGLSVLGGDLGSGSVTNSRYRLQWIDSAGAVISSESWRTESRKGAFGATNAAAAPAGTVSVQLQVEWATTSGTFPRTGNVGRIMFSDARLVVEDSPSDADKIFNSISPVEYVDILSPSHEVNIHKEGLNVGTLSAVVLDASLNPAQSNTIRPGRRVRLSSNDGYVKETMFAGRLTDADVSYEYKPETVDASVRIQIAAVDNVQRLANTSRPGGVAYIEDLPAVLEGAGVPWNCNGQTGQVVADYVSTNPDFSALDQIAITRDSRHGMAWVDRHGVLQAWSGINNTHELLADGSFSQSADGWTATNGTLTWYNGATVPNPIPGYVKVQSSAAGFAYMSTEVPLVGTRSYHIKGYSRSVTTGRVITIYVDYYDRNGTYLGTSKDEPTYSSFTNTTTWAYSEHWFTPPPGTVTGKVIAGAVGTASGEGHLYDEFSVTQVGSSPSAGADDYSDINVSFSTNECINEITVRYLRQVGEETQEVVYGPYRSQESIEEWGTHHADFTVQGLTESDAEMAAFADRIFAANGSPKVKVNEITVPVGEWLISYWSTIDLYDPLEVYGDDENSLGIPEGEFVVSSIHHSITPERWLVTLGFGDTDSVASPQVTPPVGTGAVQAPSLTHLTTPYASAVGTTTSTSYVNWSSGGPSLVFTAPVSGVVTIGGLINLKNSVGGSTYTDVQVVTKTGATAFSGTVADAQQVATTYTTQWSRSGWIHTVEGLTAGEQYNVTLQYRVNGGTGSIAQGKLSVIPSP